MNPVEIAGLVALGLAAGFASGLLGIGGAVVIIPVLVFAVWLQPTNGPGNHLIF